LSLQDAQRAGTAGPLGGRCSDVNLVIFDEAGRLRNPETLSNKAARMVGEAADGQLLLTATPIQTSEADLFNLLALLDPDEFRQL